MPCPLSAVLFDLDGTLLDTALDFETATNQLLVSEGRAPLEKGAIRAYVTNGSYGVVCAAFELEQEHPDFLRLQEGLLANYRACMTEKTKLFSGLESSMALFEDRQMPWGIVTNKPVQYAEPIVKAILPSCSVLICPDHVRITKPDPEGLMLAADRLQVRPENCVYVGDHRRDIDAGNSAGMDTVAVSWGYIDQDQEKLSDWGATHLISDPSELAPLLTTYL